MQLFGIVFMTCFGLSMGQQMCVYQEHWTSPNSVITFNSASTLFTSTMEESRIDVSKINTTGEISGKPYQYGEYGSPSSEVRHPGVAPVKEESDQPARIRIMSLIVTVGYHRNGNDSPAMAQVFIQKNGKVALIETGHKFSSSGYVERFEATVGLPNSGLQEKNLAYLLLDTHQNVKEFHETGYLTPEDTIRLVTGKVDDGYLDVSVCILYDTAR